MLLHVQHGTAWGGRCYWLEPGLIVPVLNFQMCGWGPLLHVAYAVGRREIHLRESELQTPVGCYRLLWAFT